jgi:hypothetical protein
MKKALFVLRHSDKKNRYSHGSFGLSNSATFIANRLNKIGYDAKVVVVTDNNKIDKEVSLFKPDFVFIEALWVVPEKFYELLRIHRRPEWVIRVHSKGPFLAMEGVAFDWLNRYKTVGDLYGNLRISCNSLQFNEEINAAKNYNSVYLPNIYDPNIAAFHSKLDYSRKHIDIGCFGAIRPLKNQLLQALAAITFANSTGRPMNFHMNGTRQEQQGENVLRNIKALFVNTPHKLIQHEWYGHNEFATQLVPMMDMGMQVSLTESFNIVTADFVNAGVPIVVSEDVDWMPRFSRVNPNSVQDMVKKLHFLYQGRTNHGNAHNLMALHNYNETSTKIWKDYLECN